MKIIKSDDSENDSFKIMHPEIGKAKENINSQQKQNGAVYGTQECAHS